MRLLQVCNVGRIVGGTAACAWTVTRALPEGEHHVAFLSPATNDTRQAFATATVHEWNCVHAKSVRAIKPDVVLLHNTAVDRCEWIDAGLTIQYVHSRGRRAPTDITVYCSRWLAEECGISAANVNNSVLYQAVPKPPRQEPLERRELRDRIIVGRLCTPTPAKWPAELPAFYERLASRHPEVDWEFVGCPAAMRATLSEACGGRARFLAAGWEARTHVWRWDALLYHHPTLTESFGRTVAEAMRAGCIPIVDDRGGFREQVAPGAGWLCGPLEEFDAALIALCDPKSRREVSQAAMAHADAAFSLARFRRDLLQVIRSGIRDCGSHR